MTEERKRMLRASLEAPIMLDGLSCDLLDQALPIARQRRFILCVNCPDDDAARRAVRMVK